jgi:hypothetical protein
MAKVIGFCLLIIVAVCMVGSFLFLGKADERQLKQWFGDQGMTLQCFLYAIARVASYPYIADFQHALTDKLNTVGAILVVFLGECAGAFSQSLLFEYALY